MNAAAKIVVGILATIGALYVGTMIFSAFVLDSCDKYWLARLDSADQQRTAVVEQKSCPDKPAELNLIIFQRDNPRVSHIAQLAENPATTEIYLEWRADRNLVVRHSAALELTNRPPAIGDVRIVLESLSTN